MIASAVYLRLMSNQQTTAPSVEEFTTCGRRQIRLRQALSQQKLDALLVSNPKDIHYLTNFIGDDSLLLVSANNASIITDARYDEFLEPWRGSSVAQVVMGTRHKLDEAVNRECKSQAIATLGIQAEYLTVASLSKFQTTLKSLRIENAVGLVGKLRMIKDESEIDTIIKAGALQCEALNAAIAQLELSMTEREFAGLIEYEMKRRGASGPSFDTTVSAGPNSSIIHCISGSTPICQGTLLIDWGAVLDCYCSDMTRTFAIGKFPKKVGEIYDIVLLAQQSAIDACAPGKTCAQIDGVARSIIEVAGYGEYFGHGLGHGLGLDVHEDPYLNQLGGDIVLEPGMVVTVEPGIYLPGIGGVRIEDDIAITNTGHRVLTDYPKDLNEMIIEPVVAERGAVH